MKRLIKNVGTRSILFGVHCWCIHPITVAIAWIKLYGWTWDIRIWTAFFVHDLGYWGKPNMDCVEGETHVELGANIMKFLFDKYEYIDVTGRGLAYIYPLVADDKYKMIACKHYAVSKLKSTKKGTKWYHFTLYHSSYYAKRNDAPYSKLCVADKLSFCILPKWFYLFLGNLSGEVYEYMSNSVKIKSTKVNISMNDWYNECYEYLYKWSYEHKDLQEDKETML